MKKYFLFFFILLLFNSCKEDQCNCNYQKMHIAKNDSILNSEKITHFQSNYWRRFDEQILQRDKKESYRFSIRYINKGELYIYKVTHTENDKYLLYSKKYFTQGTSNEGKAYGKDSLVYRKVDDLSEKDWDRIKSIVNSHCFWTIPIVADNRIGLEGSVWSFEGYMPNKNNCSNRKYHLVSIWSPSESSFKKICEEFYEVVNPAASGSPAPDATTKPLNEVKRSNQ